MPSKTAAAIVVCPPLSAGSLTPGLTNGSLPITRCGGFEFVVVGQMSAGKGAGSTYAGGWVVARMGQFGGIAGLDTFSSPWTSCGAGRSIETMDRLITAKKVRVWAHTARGSWWPLQADGLCQMCAVVALRRAA